MITNLCNSDTVSRDFTDAMAAIHSDRVACVPGSFNNRALVRIPLDSSRVNLIVSAGGFGAPFPDSMVTCDGMADASVIGGKFAAPSAYDIYEAAKYINSDKGYLLIYNNFMGDCLNNDLAKELMEIDGLKSIFHLGGRRTVLFIVYSVVIYLLYILGGLVIFQAFDETGWLGLRAAFVVYLFGTVGMTFSQGGIGVYPVLVQVALGIYGISMEVGTACGWLLWGSQQAAVLVVGAAYLIYFSTKKSNKRQTIK